MSTITAEQQQRIADFLATREIPSGLGTEEAACSIAAINLALSGKLTDAIPDCMSPVIGRWIISVQDSMPAEIRNSKEWKCLLPQAAGTGREKEAQRRALILDWMWRTVLPSLQDLANTAGFGEQWQTMCTEKTARAADAADAARAAADAARAAADAAADAARAAIWQKFDPCGMLAKLIEVAE